MELKQEHKIARISNNFCILFQGSNQCKIRPIKIIKPKAMTKPVEIFSQAGLFFLGLAMLKLI